jgi:hypothetical protein
MNDQLRSDLQQMQESLQEFVDFCKAHSIPMVVAAGNAPIVDDTNANLPHKLSKPDGTMIIVGAVDEAGKLWEDAVEDKDNLVTVFAPGTRIRVRPDAPNVNPLVDGTSPATAIIVCIPMNSTGQLLTL